jgi:hypothetical protein
VLCLELFFPRGFHATWALPSVTAGAGMTARHGAHVDCVGPIFHSDYLERFDTEEKVLPFD